MGDRSVNFIRIASGVILDERGFDENRVLKEPEISIDDSEKYVIYSRSQSNESHGFAMQEILLNLFYGNTNLLTRSPHPYFRLKAWLDHVYSYSRTLDEIRYRKFSKVFTPTECGIRYFISSIFYEPEINKTFDELLTETYVTDIDLAYKILTHTSDKKTKETWMTIEEYKTYISNYLSNIVPSAEVAYGNDNGGYLLDITILSNLTKNVEHGSDYIIMINGRIYCSLPELFDEIGNEPPEEFISKISSQKTIPELIDKTCRNNTKIVFNWLDPIDSDYVYNDDK